MIQIIIPVPFLLDWFPKGEPSIYDAPRKTFGVRTLNSKVEAATTRVIKRLHFPRRCTGRILLKHYLAAVKREISELVFWPLELDVKSYDVTVELQALLHVRNV
jgi:hypothetical protein